MEIERKYLLKHLPMNLEQYDYHNIEQGYICIDPVIRIRRFDDLFIMTMKSSGLLARQEYEMEIDKTQYYNLSTKIEGNLISKTRYLIPLTFDDQKLKIELDIFHSDFEGLFLAEVEFPSIDSSNKFNPPDFLGKEVTYDNKFHNSTMSSMDKASIEDFISTIPIITRL